MIICRPGVIYGPGDPGNILRMIMGASSTAVDWVPFALTLVRAIRRRIE